MRGGITPPFNPNTLVDIIYESKDPSVKFKKSFFPVAEQSTHQNLF